MAKLSKRMRAIAEKIDAEKAYGIDEAVTLLNELAGPKFKESFDIAVNLGVDPRKSDQVVRGATTLPHGTGKTVRVAVFAQGENAEKAQAAGADLVGFDDLAETVKGGQMDFDVVIATPDAMRIVGQLGKVLGPRGLMPNPKTGTVTPDVETAVKNAKAGQVQFRTDKAGIIHGSVGQVGFRAPAGARKCRGFDGGPEKGEAGICQGCVFKKGDAIHDDGAGCVHRPSVIAERIG